jgi:putative aldouronate transport system permease protein
VLASPALLALLVFSYIPMVGIVLAFKQYNVTDGLFGSPWAGLKYFRELAHAPELPSVVRNTMTISLSKLAFAFPMPILFALFLNEVKSLRTQKVFQTISYLPHFLSWVVVAGLVRALLGAAGPFNQIGSLFGMKMVLFLTKEDLFVPILILSDIWKEIGWGSIIYLAAIAGIDPQIYEAAEIDGAGRFQRMFLITVPSILHVIIILFLLRVGQVMNAGFDQIFNLYNPLVYSVGDIIDTYIYRSGLEGMRYSFAAAVGLSKNLIGLALLFLTNAVVRRFGDGAGVL